MARHGGGPSLPHVLRDSLNGESGRPTVEEEEETETTTTSTVEPSSSSSSSSSSSTKEIEKALREELNERNSKVEDEGKYAVIDGTGMDTENKEEETDGDASEDNESSSSSSSSSSPTSEELSEEIKMLERIIQKRPYPLFLAEKGAEIVEDLFSSKPQPDDYYGSLVGEEKEAGSTNGREKIVVLGTGWGGAAFLKDIDPSRYDVTVISPRNYFVFTPMLSGASVGTVDFRSITEPIREVRNETNNNIVNHENDNNDDDNNGHGFADRWSNRNTIQPGAGIGAEGGRRQHRISCL